MRDIQNVQLADLVPDSIKSDERVANAIAAIDGELSALSSLLFTPALYARISQLPGNVLDHIAWQVDSKIWRDTWPVSLKRSVIRTVILEKAKKGTRTAVEKALDSLGSAYEIREWFEMDPPGDPYTFDITVTLTNVPGQVSEQTQKDLRLRIDDTKSARSHYTLSLASQGEAALALIGGVRPVTYVRFNTIES